MATVENIPSADMTLAEWLGGITAFPVPLSALASIMLRRGVGKNALYSELDERAVRLCEADLYKWIASSASRRGAVSDSDNGWSHSDGGWSVSAADRTYYLRLANSIYDEYDEPRVSTMIKVVDFGVKRANDPVSHTFHNH